MVYLLLASRCLIAVVFLVAVVGKVYQPTRFADFVGATARLAPGWLTDRVPVRVVAGCVIAVEIAVVGLLLRPGTVAAGLALAGLALLAFAGVGELAVRRGERAACQCFGSARASLGRTQVARNLTLAALCLLASVMELRNTDYGEVEPLAAAAAMVAGLVAAIAVVFSDVVVDLFRPLT